VDSDPEKNISKQYSTTPPSYGDLSPSLSYHVGMAIGPRSYGYPQKISTMGRVKPRFSWVWHGSG